MWCSILDDMWRFIRLTAGMEMSLVWLGGEFPIQPIIVAKELVTPSDSDNGEPGPAQRCHQVRSRDARNPAHAAMVMR